MLYCLVTPIFLLVVLIQLLALAVVAAVPSLRPARDYLWRVLIWSSVGFIVANVLVAILGALPFFVLWALHEVEPRSDSAFQRLLATSGVAILFLGPVVASGVGFVGGVCWGVDRASKARRSDPGPRPAS